MRNGESLIRRQATRQGDLPSACTPVTAGDLPDDLVELGYVAEAHGIRGWLKIQPHSADGEVLLGARRWWLRWPGECDAYVIEIARSREHSGSIVAQPKGIDGRDAAEALKGFQVWVPRSAFPAPQENEFYWVDLIGAQVTNLQGETLGKVSGLLDNGAHAVLRVTYPAIDRHGAAQDAERLIPFVGQYVHEVDTASGRIVVDWGLDY